MVEPATAKQYLYEVGMYAGGNGDKAPHIQRFTACEPVTDGDWLSFPGPDGGALFRAQRAAVLFVHRHDIVAQP